MKCEGKKEISIVPKFCVLDKDMEETQRKEEIWERGERERLKDLEKHDADGE